MGASFSPEKHSGVTQLSPLQPRRTLPPKGQMAFLPSSVLMKTSGRALSQISGRTSQWCCSEPALPQGRSLCPSSTSGATLSA